MLRMRCIQKTQTRVPNPTKILEQFISTIPLIYNKMLRLLGCFIITLFSSESSDKIHTLFDTMEDTENEEGW